MNKPSKRFRIEIGQPTAVTIFLVGCGGTGSFAALHLARLAYSAKDRFRLKLVFIDPDYVEAKNLGRQNFCEAELGKAKAVALARRYSFAFGLEIQPVVALFDRKLLAEFRPDVRYGEQSLSLLVGCVDNAAARSEMARALEEMQGYSNDLWWLDSGNSEDAGNIYLGNSLKRKPKIDGLLGACTHLPAPHVQEPGVLTAPEVAAETPLSCAELVALEAQSLMINQMMAGWLGVYVYRLLLAGDLDMMATLIDQRLGLAHSTPIVGEAEVALPKSERLIEGAVGRCPDCGGPIYDGLDDADEGETVEIVYCEACDWQTPREDYEMLIAYAGEEDDELETLPVP